LEIPHEPKKKRVSTVVIGAIFLIGIVAAASLGYIIGYSAIQGRINDLQSQLFVWSNVPHENNTFMLNDNVSLSRLYKEVKESVVVVQGLLVQYDIFHRPYYSQVQGSGFVSNATGQAVIVTNYHVVQNAINVTVTFKDGNAYSATVLGSDPYVDLGVLSTSAPQSELKPATIASSSSLEVGDPVIAVGTPYGLAGSMTLGIVSALGRTITESMTGGYPIASVIQTSTPINPGNSGGPLLDYEGQVVGITTAIVSDSQGLGFAIPSNAILREIGSLVTTGKYEQHSSLRATGTDMTYEVAQAMDINVTYGWLIASASADTGLHGGTSQVIIAGETVAIGGDIIIAINGARITNIDDLSTYLEEYTFPNQTINATVVRNNQTMVLAVKLGSRPSLS